MKEIREIDIGSQGFVSLRVILITVFLGVGAVLYFKNDLRDEAFFLILVIALDYLLISLYFLFYPVFQNYINWLNGLQIGFDITLASWVVYITGGKSSSFVFLYALIIVFANIVFSRLAGYVAALTSGILYLLIVLYQFNSEFSMSSNGSLLPNVLWGDGAFEHTYFNLAGFLLIAMLSGYLSKNISTTRRELSESNKSLIILKNLYENILQSLTSGVITTDIGGRLISINKTALEILGINGEDKVLGRELGYLIQGLRVEERLSKRREEILYSTPDGRELSLGFSSSVLRDTEGDMQGYIVIFQDLTEVKKLEERFRISEKMALLGQLGAGLAHEIRNPLSAISGTVEVLSTEVKPSEENLRLLRVASDQVQRLNLIVEDFLILTKPIEESEIPTDVSLIVDETVESFLNATRRDGILIAVETEKELHVQAEPQRLKQVIWNLLLNAMEAMPSGGKIMIRANSEAGDVIIRVSDEGLGIKKGIVAKIFEPFFTTREVGTGLGLTIVQKVVEGYNGRVSVMSSENEGTTFIVSLPEAQISKKEDETLRKTEIHDKVQMCIR